MNVNTQFLSTAFLAILLFLPATAQQFGNNEDEVGIVIGLTLAALFGAIVVPLLRDRMTTASCDGNYLQYREHCYKFVRDRQSWQDAKSTCADSGDDLVSIETADESNWIIEKIEQLDGNTEEIQVSTTGAFNAVAEQLPLFGRDWISFYVKACKEAYIVLKAEQGETTDYYAVGLGTNVNQYVTIFKGFPNDATKEKTINIPNTLDCNEFSAFWVSYNEGLIQVGKGLKKGVDLVLEWQDPSYIDVRYIVVTGWNIDVDWKFHNGMEYWTSGSANAVTSFYEWGSGESAELGFTNWKTNEPSRAVENMDCLALDTKWDNNGKWGDEICECKFAFICEKKVTKTSRRIFSL